VTAISTLRSLAILAIAFGVVRAAPAPERGAVHPSLGRLAILPAENLTGRSLDAAPIEEALGSALASRGVEVLPAADLRALMDRHRVRFTGGLDPELAKAFREEAGVAGAVITSVERWSEKDPPELGLTVRVVATSPDLRVVRASDVGLHGEDRPGFLDLGVVHDPVVLVDRAAATLADVMTSPEPSRGSRSGSEGRFRPRLAYGAATGHDKPTAVRVAVLPFTNRSERRGAGELIALHFARRLADLPGVEVVEPGLVRSVLLKLRLIPAGGISYSQADVLRETLGADLLVTGDLLDYAEGAGEGAPPVVDYTAQLLDTASRRVVWSSFSHNTGSDRVWFFGQGRLRSAAALGSAMAQSTVDRMFRRKGQP
jgi:hypothetical protein